METRDTTTHTLKIGPLPDRTPSKLTVSLDPELHSDLTDYAFVYAETYGQDVKVSDIVPSMLRALLDSDAGFKRAQNSPILKTERTIQMANIGYFQKTRSGYEGTINTLTLCTPARIVPNRKKQRDTSPDYFIKTEDSDLGVAWKAESSGGDPKTYLRCLLDDPSFAGPIQAALFDRGQGG